ncbi:MAG: N-acetyltransferase [Candidatus Hydrogenedentes bacterium]|nr:N-acetyltransferase [Candidatus Hydrogenedentota bacterium]
MTIEVSISGAIRKPTTADAPAIKQLIDEAVAAGALLPRSLAELCEYIRDFLMYVDERCIGGCCALHVDLADLAEIRSLVVREDLRGRHVGVRLVEACLAEARNLGIARVYALTRVPAFFEKLGFHQVEKSELPHKVFKDCLRCHLFPGCDEIAMVRDLKSYKPSAALAELRE